MTAQLRSDMLEAAVGPGPSVARELCLLPSALRATGCSALPQRDACDVSALVFQLQQGQGSPQSSGGKGRYALQTTGGLTYVDRSPYSGS